MVRPKGQTVQKKSTQTQHNQKQKMTTSIRKPQEANKEIRKII